MRKFIFLLVVLGGMLLTLSITGKDSSSNQVKNESLPQAAAAVKKDVSEKESRDLNTAPQNKRWGINES